MAQKRVFAGFYTRYDGKPIFVVRVLKDIDTGESTVVCKDASFAKEDNEHYYLIRYTSFCEQVEVDGVLRDKYVRQTRREIDEGTVREVYEYGFPESKSKPFTLLMTSTRSALSVAAESRRGRAAAGRALSGVRPAFAAAKLIAKEGEDAQT